MRERIIDVDTDNDLLPLSAEFKFHFPSAVEGEKMVGAPGSDKRTRFEKGFVRDVENAVGIEEEGEEEEEEAPRRICTCRYSGPNTSLVLPILLGVT